VANTVAIGSATTSSITDLATSISINSTNTALNTVNLGGAQTTSNTIRGDDIYINSTFTTANDIYVGGALTLTADVKADTLNLNRTNFLTGNEVNIGSTATTVNIGESSATVINSYPISPALTTYNVSTGTNIVGSIGYIYRGSASTGSFPNNSLLTSGTISNVPVGVYYVSATVAIDTTTVGQINYQQYSLDDGVSTSTFAMTGIASGTAPGNCVDRIYYGNVSGCICLTTTSTLSVRSFWQFTSGTFTRSANSFNFTAVRIA
jgi:hypothetical protein